jgi:hypothetical protein
MYIIWKDKIVVDLQARGLLFTLRDFRERLPVVLLLQSAIFPAFPAAHLKMVCMN